MNTVYAIFIVQGVVLGTYGPGTMDGCKKFIDPLNVNIAAASEKSGRDLRSVYKCVDSKRKPQMGDLDPTTPQA